MPHHKWLSGFLVHQKTSVPAFESSLTLIYRSSCQLHVCPLAIAKFDLPLPGLAYLDHAAGSEASFSNTFNGLTWSPASHQPTEEESPKNIEIPRKESPNHARRDANKTARKAIPIRPSKIRS